MNAKTCPNCQSPIPEHAPGGFCPACLLRDAAEPAALPHDAPSLPDVAAAFPKLEILKLIGHGGMGFVYQARQPELDRTVALKLLSPALRRDPAFEERFAREARVLGKLKHPNIVTLYEHGESGGYFYLMMEFVDGVNLRQAMSAGRFTPEQALAIVPSICDALQSAHAEGVWHRDIKPENILLDRDGRVKIADFGIARILGDPERNFTLTRTGGQLGSVAYMAPEQHEKPHSVDHRADIYSLGVVIYEMLTGELPLGRFPLPSQRAAVNARIDEIVMRTLEKELELRQQSAGEVKTEVEGAATMAGQDHRQASGSDSGQIPPPLQGVPFKWLILAPSISMSVGIGLMLLNKAGVPMSPQFMQAVIPVIFFALLGVGIAVMKKRGLRQPSATEMKRGVQRSAVVSDGISSGAIDFTLWKLVLPAVVLSLIGTAWQNSYGPNGVRGITSVGFFRPWLACFIPGSSGAATVRFYPSFSLIAMLCAGCLWGRWFWLKRAKDQDWASFLRVKGPNFPLKVGCMWISAVAFFLWAWMAATGLYLYLGALLSGSTDLDGLVWEFLLAGIASGTVWTLSKTLQFSSSIVSLNSSSTSSDRLQKDHAPELGNERERRQQSADEVKTEVHRAASETLAPTKFDSPASITIWGMSLFLGGCSLCALCILGQGRRLDRIVPTTLMAAGVLVACMGYVAMGVALWKMHRGFIPTAMRRTLQTMMALPVIGLMLFALIWFKARNPTQSVSRIPDARIPDLVPILPAPLVQPGSRRRSITPETSPSQMPSNEVVVPPPIVDSVFNLNELANTGRRDQFQWSVKGLENMTDPPGAAEREKAIDYFMDQLSGKMVGIWSGRKENGLYSVFVEREMAGGKREFNHLVFSSGIGRWMVQSAGAAQLIALCRVEFLPETGDPAKRLAVLLDGDFQIPVFENGFEVPGQFDIAHNLMPSLITDLASPSKTVTDEDAMAATDALLKRIVEKQRTWRERASLRIVTPTRPAIPAFQLDPEVVRIHPKPTDEDRAEPGSPQDAIEALFKAARENDKKALIAGCSRSVVAIADQDGRLPASFNDIARVRFVGEKVHDEKTVEVWVETTDGSSRRFAYWLIQEDGKWKLTEHGR